MPEVPDIMPADAIKVRVVMTISVSPSEWNEAYGSDESNAEIREAVRGIARQSADYDIHARGLSVKVD